MISLAGTIPKSQPCRNREQNGGYWGLEGRTTEEMLFKGHKPTVKKDEQVYHSSRLIVQESVSVLGQRECGTSLCLPFTFSMNRKLL